MPKLSIMPVFEEKEEPVFVHNITDQEPFRASKEERMNKLRDFIGNLISFLLAEGDDKIDALERYESLTKSCWRHGIRQEELDKICQSVVSVYKSRPPIGEYKGRP